MTVPFTNNTPAATYRSILNTANNFSGFDGVMRAIQDGDGEEAAFQIGPTGINIPSGFYLGSILVTSDANEINKLDRVKADGLIQASKVVVADSSRHINTLGGHIIYSGGTAHSGVFKRSAVSYNNLGSVLSSGDFNVRKGHFHKIDLIGNSVSIGLKHGTSGWAGSQDATYMDAMVRQDATGGRGVLWQANIEWLEGHAPVIASGVRAKTPLRFFTHNQGANWFGFPAVRNPDILTLDTIYMGRNQPPSGTSTPATPDVRNHHLVLDFDANTAETGIFPIKVPNYWRGQNVTVELVWAASSATTGGVAWGVAFERMAEDSLDIDADGFGTELRASGTAPSAAGKLDYVTVDFTRSQANSIRAGEAGRLRVVRKVADTHDTMTGDAELLRLEIKEKV